MARHGKNYVESKSRVDREREYEPADAVALLKELKAAKFDESVELHIRTGLNVRHADEQLRGTIALPHGLGKDVKIAVFAQGDKAREAEEAGADIVGADDLAKKIEEGFTDFDVAIATPDMMPVVGRLGRVLGPQGKMPNPRSARSPWTSRRPSRSPSRARSSTAPTAPRSSISTSARSASTSGGCWRTTQP